MTERRLELQVDAGDRGERLDRFLARRLRSLGRTHVQRLVRQGAVEVDGRVETRPSRRLAGAGRLVVRVPRPVEAPLVLGPDRVLLADDDLLVLDKPAGYAVRSRLSLAGEDVLDAALRLTGQARLWPAHRLDRATSGVLVLARHAAAARALAAAFRRGGVRKVYAARVASAPEPPHGRIELPVLAPGDGTLPRIDPAGRAARTRYRTVARSPGGALVVLRLLTGRTHQARLHLAAIGRPIAGDRVHGGAPAERLALHAVALRLVHPGTGRALRLRAPLPREVWPPP